MILSLTITQDRMEAALYPNGPRLVFADYHKLLSAISTLEKSFGKKTLDGILVVIGPVSFTRHRQTIALVNAVAATRQVPSYAFEYIEEAPSAKTIAQAMQQLVKAKKVTILIPHYRAAPTITLKK